MGINDEYGSIQPGSGASVQTAMDGETDLPFD
jgi:hypothetical protein